jgi:hypothetical protein
MNPIEYSPNWYWSRLGYRINRDGLRRTITDCTGAIVCVNAGYDTELGIARWLYFGAIAVLTLHKANASNCPPSIDKGQTNHTNQL